MEPTPGPTDSQPDAPLLPESALRDPVRVAAVLAAVLEQQGREASANRAQARELIRAVEGMAKAQEFLGLELRTERARSRRLVALLTLVPLAVAGVAGFLVWQQFSRSEERNAGWRRDVGAEIASLRDRGVDQRIAEAKRDLESRLVSAESAGSALRGDLDAARTALEAERTAREARDRDVARRLTESERDRTELAGLRAEVASLRDVAGAERARADELTRRLLAPAAPVVAPTTPPAAASEAPLPAPAVPPARSPDPAARDPRDLERIRSTLNGLLEGVTGAAKYEIDALSGVSGTDLLGIRVTGRDAEGRVLRVVEAARAEIRVEEAGGVRLRFADGRVLVSGRSAPFFDGSYTLVLEGSADAWRRSGLSCIRVP